MRFLPRLSLNVPITGTDGNASAYFQRYWEEVLVAIENAVDDIAINVNAIQAALDAAGIATAAAVAANAAAATANTAAADSQAAADAAAAAAAANAAETALVNSYINPSSVLSSSTTTITVAAHSRIYADPALTTVAVSGGVVAATGPGPVVNYVSYVQPSRAGGAVTYIASTAAPTQGADVHVVGAITVPAAGTATGGTGPRRPGYVEP